MELGPDDQKEMDARFTYHPPNADQIPKYNALRSAAKEFAEMVVELCPVSREQALALTNIEQGVMWANAAIARRSE